MHNIRYAVFVAGIIEVVIEYIKTEAAAVCGLPAYSIVISDPENIICFGKGIRVGNGFVEPTCACFTVIL